MKHLSILSLLVVLLWSCELPPLRPNQASTETKTTEEQPAIIEKPNLKLESDILTAEVLWSMGRIGEYALSPDLNTVVYTVTYYNKDQNKGNSEMFALNLKTKEKTRLTTTRGSEYNPVWKTDASKIAYLSATSGTMQMWEMNCDGTNPIQISKIEGGINGFKFSPNGKKVVYIADVKLDTTAQDRYPDLKKATGRIVTDMMYRHWDNWVDTYSHVFVADYDGKSLTNNKDIMQGEMWESPVRPHGGMEQITFSADNQTVIYTARKKRGAAYAISTNTDLYAYDVNTTQTKNLTQGMMGYDMEPVCSSDGKFVAFNSMERDGYESDIKRLMLLDLQTGTFKNMTDTMEQNAEHIVFSNDNSKLYFISDWHATDDIYEVELSTGKIRKMTEGMHDYTAVTDAGSYLLATKMSISKPTEFYLVDKSTGKDEEISFENKDLLSQLTMGESVPHWVKTTDGKEMLVWLILPPHFDSTKTYPTLLYCQGGPQSTVSQFWSYRWNFQMMAANGYIVVAPNRRGLPGFGKEWNEQISGDYSGQNMKDYLSAIDYATALPYVDKNRLGAVGASYGAYSVYWLAGNHNKRFKTFIAHNGIFNLEAQYTETEEVWFANWDMGGAYWDLNNKTAQRTFKNSPHRFVQNWDTPIYVIHSDRDYRITYTQGMQAFNAARLKGIDAQWLYFPDETHFVLKPQNGIMWQRAFFDWLDKYLKK